MLTIGCFTAWKKPIGWSNCVRTRAYSAVVCSCHSAAPQRSAATIVRIAGSAASSDRRAACRARRRRAAASTRTSVELEPRLVARQVDDVIGADRQARRVGGHGVEADAARASRGDDEERRLARVLHERRGAAEHDAVAGARRGDASVSWVPRARRSGDGERRRLAAGDALEPAGAAARSACACGGVTRRRRARAAARSRPAWR